MADYTFILNNHIIILSEEDADIASMKLHIMGKTHLYAASRTWNKKLKNRTSKKIHRIILERKLGRQLLPNEISDHINGNTLDNRRENLRLADKAGNGQNAKKRKDNGSGYKGVSKNHGRWAARIQVRGVNVFIGNYGSPEEAHEAYCKAASLFHGEFARFE